MIRTSSIGDIIFCFPIVLAIKKTFPGCEITWLVDQRFELLVQSDHLIDKVISWPKEEWKTLIVKKKRVIEKIRWYLEFPVECLNFRPNVANVAKRY